ncbi:hypothetical protein CHU92_00785 [Flavobacterium cyanobacteriorum]|uniref:DUF2975 domain-containing protein n=1 Tax=Flavobacterium cyanobacteriorum TaxID=2022802 RepID=A0A256A3J0_9FLAO|nr:DUF2975 domain-containing protein [Flavobacterium cyanobacteriorum]OYQ48232.1 hypothetical protein CHU92_00785 [Flavobacterium cyanobacteriorum]
MEKLPFLRTLTGITFILCMVILVFAVPFIFMALFFPAQVPFEVNGTKAVDMAPEDYVMLGVKIVVFGIWTYALYLFRGILTLFSKKKIFDDAVILLLGNTGKALLAGFILYFISEFLYNVIVENTFSVGIGAELLVVILALFFMVLSEVFLTAKKMKEENDLTI